MEQPLDLSEEARAWLDDHGARRPSVPTPAEMTAALEVKGYEAHRHALAFDAAYGGIEVSDDLGPWTIGAHACATSDAHVHPEGGRANTGRGLVPVIYLPNDVIYFIDREGTVYVQDTIEDTDASALPMGPREMLETVLLWED